MRSFLRSCASIANRLAAPVSGRRLGIWAGLVALAGFSIIGGAGLGGAAPAATPAVGNLGDAEGVEQPALRTRTSRTYLDTDGVYQAVISAGSVNFKDPAGNWQPIDTKLVASGDGFGVTANSYGLTLPSQAGAPVKVSLGTSFITLSLVGASAPASIAGNMATYSNARPATDLSYETTPDTVKETITLRDRTAPAVQSYRITTSADLSAALVRRELRLTDRLGAVRFSLAAPFLEDAAGVRSDDVAVAMTRDAQGILLTVTPDATWLASPARKFPVIIDPTITPGASTDCSIISGSSATTNYCSDSLLKVGYDGTKTYRSILKFDVSSIPAQSTVFSSYVATSTTGSTTGTTLTTTANRLTRAFTSSATWNTYNGTSAWTTAGGDFAATPEYSQPMAGNTGYKYWYNTAVTQEWVDGTTANNGLILKPTTSAVNVVSFASAQNATSSIRPFMSVSYQPWLGAREVHSFESFRLTDRMGLTVNVANGNLGADYADVQIAGTGLPLSIGHHFNSVSPYFGAPQGNKWVVDDTDQVKLTQFGNAKVYQGPGGYRVPFLPDGSGGYITPSGVNAKLVKNPDNSFTMTFDHSGIRFQYSSAGVFTRIEDRNGNHIDMAYNGSGRTSTVTDTQGRALTFAYNGSGYLSSLTDSTGRQQTYTYDVYNYLRTITDAAGKQTLMEYTDPSNSLTKVTDPLGNVAKMTYDADGRVLTITRVTNTIAGTGPVTTYSYSASQTGCPSGTVGATSSTDPNSHVTRYCYDRLGRVLGTFDGNGHLDRATLTANSDPDVATSATGDVTDLSYNANDELTGVSLPEGTTQSYTYADAGHPDLATTATDASGLSTSFVYTAVGNVCSVSSGASPPTTCVTAASNQTKLTYNSDGSIATSIDPNGNLTSYGYTAGNLTSIDHPAPRGDETLGYDALSRLTSRTDGKGQTTTYAYDTRDRLTSVTYLGGATITYGYDDAGNRTSRVDNTGTTTYGFDALNRLTSEGLPGGRTNTYALDGKGNLISLTDAGGTVAYSYDSADKVTSVTEPGGIQTTLAYDADGRLVTTTLPSGTGVSVARTWDGTLPTRIRATRGATVLTDFLSCYRVPASGCSTTPQTGAIGGRRSRIDDVVAGNVSDFTYDGAGRLTRVQTTGASASDFQYGYDAADNRTSQTVNGGAPTVYGYNAAGQMMSVGGITYTYDGNGNLTGNSAGMSLSYNAKDQTTSITPAGGSALAMTYSGPDQSERTQAGGTSYTYNGLGLGYETTSGVTTYYTRLPDGALLGERQTTGRFYPLTDGAGSVVRLVDSSGAVLNSYTYEPYGSVTTSSGSVPNPFKFAGSYEDPSGLYKNGARYLDPATGTWTQTDPNQSGQTTPLGPGYGYALSDPVNNSDPSGRYTVTGCLYPQTWANYVPMADVRPLLRPLCVPRRIYLISTPNDVRPAFTMGFLWCYAVSLNGYGPKYSQGALWTGGSAYNWCAAGSRGWSYVRWWR